MKKDIDINLDQPKRYEGQTGRQLLSIARELSNGRSIIFIAANDKVIDKERERLIRLCEFMFGRGFISKANKYRIESDNGGLVLLMRPREILTRTRVNTIHFAAIDNSLDCPDDKFTRNDISEFYCFANHFNIKMIDY